MIQISTEIPQFLSKAFVFIVSIQLIHLPATAKDIILNLAKFTIVALLFRTNRLGF